MKTKHISTFLMVLLTITLLSGCNFSQMPFNGDITFHDISLTVNERFIRDSTQSTEDLWFFEKGYYSELIILSRKEADEDIEGALEEYAEYMTEQGVNAALSSFLNKTAVFSSYTRDGQYCQEVLFAHGGSFYAIALRGGTEEDFATLINTIRVHEK